MIVRATARSVLRDQRGGIIHPVVQENVIFAIGIAGHQVGGKAAIHHVAPVSGEGGGVAVTVRAAARSVLRDQRGGIIDRVVKEYVIIAIGIAGHQVGGKTVIGHIAPVGGD